MPASAHRGSGGLVLDEVRREVLLHGDVVDLRPAEYALLAALMRRPGAAMSSAELLKAMWGVEWQADTALLQVHVSRLRSKLGESAAAPRFILTMYGFGYRFEPIPIDAPADPVGQEGGEDESGEDPARSPVYVLLSIDRTIAWASEGVRDMLGWEPQDLVGMSLYDLAPKEQRVTMLNARADLNAGNPAALDLSIRMADGDFRRLAASVRPVVDAAGKVTGFLAGWRPSGRAEGQEALAPVRLAAGPQVKPEPQIVTLHIDRDLVLRELSPRQRLLGWEPEEIIGGFYSPVGLGEATLRTLVSSLAAAGQLEISGPIDVRHRDGSVVAAYVEHHIDVDVAGGFAGLRSTMYLGSLE